LDGKEANFVNSVLNCVKEYLFPHYKFLKDGWMEYDNGQESLSTFVQGKVKIPERVECVCVCVSDLRLRLGYCKCMRYQSLVPSR
jgi:hypothetical protein